MKKLKAIPANPKGWKVQQYVRDETLSELVTLSLRRERRGSRVVLVELVPNLEGGPFDDSVQDLS